ncbi:MAG: efflux RND transporter periplasmic adaptor subunit [Pseudomonadota bacterium]
MLRLLATLAVCAAVAFVYLLEPHEEVELVREPPPKPVVSIVPVPVQKTRAVVETLAQIKPMWSAELHASHSARVLSVSDRALAGRRVERGDVLIELDPSALLSDLRAAELALVEAEVRLSQARQQTELRRREAERVGDENPSEFALLLPDLRVAETNLVSAQASVAAAQAASANAKIRAPFDGFVTTRIVSPGQSVSAGEELLSVVTGTAFEIEVGLSSAQWRLLEHPIRKTQAKVYALDGTALGTAEIRDAGGFRDEETREFRVFLEINRDQNLAPDVQLISGALVNVAFVGRTFDNTLQIPENSFTREGGVWYVDELGRLQRFQPDVLWRSDGDLIIAAPADGPVYEIATVPLASFLTGTEVSAVPDERP